MTPAHSVSKSSKVATAPGALRSFGRTTSRMSEKDLEKLDTRLAPYELHIDIPENIGSSGQVFPEPLELTQIFRKKKAPLVVEIGCGNGEYIFNRATAHPSANHIGVEVYKNGLRSLVFKLEQLYAEEEQDVSNLKMCTQDARFLLTALPENSVDEVVILYADPWPKKKHHKRRLINTELLNMLGTTIKPGGTLFIATDWPDYAKWILAHALAHPVFELDADCPADLGMPPQGWRSTKYERKALKEGRKPWYFTFKRVEESAT